MYFRRLFFLLFIAAVKVDVTFSKRWCWGVTAIGGGGAPLTGRGTSIEAWAAAAPGGGVGGGTIAVLVRVGVSLLVVVGAGVLNNNKLLLIVGSMDG